MRNLKKFLCLALALTLALSLVVLPTAQAVDPTKLSDFSDASGVSDANKEAVDVLVAIGMVKGDDTTGTLLIDPQGSYTRAQAATLIARYVLGSDAAARLPAPSVAPFDDVAPDYWAAKYIAYVKNAGIINGLGDGTYNPNGAVTASAMLKLLLAASGYGQAGEYVGSSWEMNAITDATRLWIVPPNLPLNVDLTAPANRENVFMYTFNALTGVARVTYNQFFGYVPEGATVNTQGGFSNQGQSQGWKVFRLEAYGITGTGANAGLQMHNWRQDNKNLTLSAPAYISGTVIDSFTAGSTSKPQLYTKYRWNLGSQNATALTIVRNGRRYELNAEQMVTNGAESTENNAIALISSATPSFLDGGAFGNPAAKITLYDLNNDGTVEIVVIKDEFLAKVVGFDSTFGWPNLDVYMGTAAAKRASAVAAASGKNLAVDDYVRVIPQRAAADQAAGTDAAPNWYTPNAHDGTGYTTTINEAERADSKEGTLNSAAARTNASYVADSTIAPSSITLDGETLNVADIATAATVFAPASGGFASGEMTKATRDLTFGTTFVAYLSGTGYVLGFEGKTTSDYTGLDYLYLQSFDAQSPGIGDTSALASTVAGGVALFPDGSIRNIRLQVIGTGTQQKFGINIDSTTDANGNVTVKSGGTLVRGNDGVIAKKDDYKAKWYSYTINSDGTYTLKISHPVATAATGAEGTATGLAFERNEAGALRPIFSIGFTPAAGQTPRNAPASKQWSATTTTVMVANGVTRTGLNNFAIVTGLVYDTNNYAALAVRAANAKSNIAGRIYVVKLTDVGDDGRTLGIVTAKDGSIINGKFNITVKYMETTAKTISLSLDKARYNEFAVGNFVTYVDAASGDDDVEKVPNNEQITGVVIDSSPGRVTLAGPMPDQTYAATPMTPANTTFVVDVWFDAATALINTNGAAITGTTEIAKGMTVTITFDPDDEFNLETKVKFEALGMNVGYASAFATGPYAQTLLLPANAERKPYTPPQPIKTIDALKAAAGNGVHTWPEGPGGNPAVDTMLADSDVRNGAKCLWVNPGTILDLPGVKRANASDVGTAVGDWFVLDDNGYLYVVFAEEVLAAPAAVTATAISVVAVKDADGNITITLPATVDVPSVFGPFPVATTEAKFAAAAGMAANWTVKVNGDEVTVVGLADVSTTGVTLVLSEKLNALTATAATVTLASKGMITGTDMTVFGGTRPTAWEAATTAIAVLATAPTPPAPPAPPAP